MELRFDNLTNEQLDYFVALAEGILEGMPKESKSRYWTLADIGDKMVPDDWRPTVNESQARPIIEREGIWITQDSGRFKATCRQTSASGDTALVAAMRCFVALKYGFQF